MSKMTTVLTGAMPHATVAPVARATLHRQKLAHSLNTNVHANSPQTLTVVLGFLLNYCTSYFTL